MADHVTRYITFGINHRSGFAISAISDSLGQLLMPNRSVLLKLLVQYHLDLDGISMGDIPSGFRNNRTLCLVGRKIPSKYQHPRFRSCVPLGEISGKSTNKLIYLLQPISAPYDPYPVE